MAVDDKPVDPKDVKPADAKDPKDVKPVDAKDAKPGADTGAGKDGANPDGTKPGEPKSDGKEQPGGFDLMGLLSKPMTWLFMGIAGIATYFLTGGSWLWALGAAALGGLGAMLLGNNDETKKQTEKTAAEQKEAEEKKKGIEKQLTLEEGKLPKDDAYKVYDEQMYKAGDPAKSTDEERKNAAKKAFDIAKQIQDGLDPNKYEDLKQVIAVAQAASTDKALDDATQKRAAALLQNLQQAKTNAAARQINAGEAVADIAYYQVKAQLGSIPDDFRSLKDPYKAFTDNKTTGTKDDGAKKQASDLQTKAEAVQNKVEAIQALLKEVSDYGTDKEKEAVTALLAEYKKTNGVDFAEQSSNAKKVRDDVSLWMDATFPGVDIEGLKAKLPATFTVGALIDNTTGTFVPNTNLNGADYSSISNIVVRGSISNVLLLDMTQADLNDKQAKQQKAWQDKWQKYYDENKPNWFTSQFTISTPQEQEQATIAYANEKMKVDIPDGQHLIEGLVQRPSSIGTGIIYMTSKPANGDRVEIFARALGHYDQNNYIIDQMEFISPDSKQHKALSVTDVAIEKRTLKNVNKKDRHSIVLDDENRKVLADVVEGLISKNGNDIAPLLTSAAPLDAILKEGLFNQKATAAEFYDNGPMTADITNGNTGQTSANTYAIKRENGTQIVTVSYKGAFDSFHSTLIADTMHIEWVDTGGNKQSDDVKLSDGKSRTLNLKPMSDKNKFTANDDSFRRDDAAVVMGYMNGDYLAKRKFASIQTLKDGQKEADDAKNIPFTADVTTTKMQWFTAWDESLSHQKLLIKPGSFTLDKETGIVKGLTLYGADDDSQYKVAKVNNVDNTELALSKDDLESVKKGDMPDAQAVANALQNALTKKGWMVVKFKDDKGNDVQLPHIPQMTPGNTDPSKLFVKGDKDINLDGADHGLPPVALDLKFKRPENKRGVGGEDAKA